MIGWEICAVTRCAALAVCTTREQPRRALPLASLLESWLSGRELAPKRAIGEAPPQTLRAAPGASWALQRRSVVHKPLPVGHAGELA